MIVPRLSTVPDRRKADVKPIAAPPGPPPLDISATAAPLPTLAELHTRRITLPTGRTHQ